MKVENFDRMKTREMAVEIEKLNSRMLKRTGNIS
jgi:hypothetical protein